MGGDQGLMRWGPRKRLAPSLAGEERGLLSSCTPQGRPQGDSEKEAVSVPGTEPSSNTQRLPSDGALLGPPQPPEL